jgi:hypothetical protein
LSTWSLIQRHPPPGIRTATWIPAKHFASDDPSSAKRLIGVPVVIVAMTSSEAEELFVKQDPGVQVGLGKLRATLERDGLQLAFARYRARCTDWKPFHGGTHTIRQIVTMVIESVNKSGRQPRGTLLKPQYYPFDPHSEPSRSLLEGDLPRVAKTGCVVVLDEVSMFHGRIQSASGMALLSNNTHVSLVSISLFHPDETAITC